MEFEMFENRLAKMNKHIGKWARRQGITCYRVYDHDVPQFPFAIDKYGEWIHVAEYETNYVNDEVDTEAWFLKCISIIALTFDTTIDKVFVKRRKQQKGSQQYEKVDSQSHFQEVQENGLNFLVNFQDYLDTGLFLDHRPLRQIVGQQSNGKKVLNLFAYSGSFSIYAAANGAQKVVTIDLSNTYIQWAKENFKANNLEIEKHEFIQADVLQWLDNPTESGFDIIILDPPTFSNSKRMDDILDVQRDHIHMINQCLAILNEGGILYFSTNFRKFKLQAELLNSDKIKDISNWSIPEDFRDKKIHYCWEIRK
jgi:23S rRNA (cytosine1962-C5)-methyltransferase